MIYSGHAHSYYTGTAVARRDGNGNEGGGAYQPRPESIPRRYRDGRGGINLERVRQDQRRARRDLVRAVALRLRAFWRG